VWVDHSRQNRFACSTCELELAVYDHATEREWRHLDSGQFLTNLHAKSPRVNCPEHGVLQVRLPWAEHVPVHNALRTSGRRCAQRVRRAGCQPPAAHQLGRNVASHAAGRGPGFAVKEPGAPAHIE
jgi:transposase